MANQLHLASNLQCDEEDEQKLILGQTNDITLNGISEVGFN